MILNGKAKEDFLNFYWNNYIGKTRFLDEKEKTEDFFISLYPILQNALMIEWFDSVGIWKTVFYNVYMGSIVTTKFSQILNKAIVKANDIYNESN